MDMVMVSQASPVLRVSQVALAAFSETLAAFTVASEALYALCCSVDSIFFAQSSLWDDQDVVFFSLITLRGDLEASIVATAEFSWTGLLESAAWDFVVFLVDVVFAMVKVNC